MHSNSRPYLGLGILITRNNNFLLGKRKGSHGEGEYSCPGGHIEWGETIEETAKREAFEETGLIVKNIRLLSIGNYMFERSDGDRHYVGIDIICDCEEGEPILREPDKCEGWVWYNTGNIPKPLFKETRVMIESYISNNYPKEHLGIWR